ncbi:hypothetical protein GCM10023205_53270 [Yinghuangia aomiensis]|uniref:N-acetyltransferase domain-containing protein n=1 Tax=Yinghuangia aomiensis TaxID=676205 RepID=A0ABP9HU04_9ACTN
MKILRAGEAHLAAIAALARSRSLSQLEDATARREGFLVSGYDEHVYRARLSAAEHFHVAMENGTVIGFVLAYSNLHFDADEWLNHHVAKELGQILVVKQVCVSRGAADSGVGSRLYRYILDRWTTTPVVAAVVAEPNNEASAAFHTKHGFTIMLSLRPQDGRLRNVWVRPRPTAP